MRINDRTRLDWLASGNYERLVEWLPTGVWLDIERDKTFKSLREAIDSCIRQEKTDGSRKGD